MSKHHPSKKIQPANRVSGSMSPLSQEGLVPSYDQIQKKAYEIHEQKGGSDFENWLEAERILKEEHAHQ